MIQLCGLAQITTSIRLEDVTNRKQIFALSNAIKVAATPWERPKLLVDRAE
jgi:hypothetical protein